MSRMLSVALLATAAIALAGCKDPGAPPCTICPPQAAGPNYRPNTTPAAPLYNLQQAYRTRDADAVRAYLSMIHDAYVFRFYDLHSSTPTAAVYWNAAQEDSAATQLLRDRQVNQIDLQMSLADTAMAEPSSFAGDPAGTQKITLQAISLQLSRGDIVYQCVGSCAFYVAPVGEEYRIIRWEDNTAPPQGVPPAISGGATAVAPSTWGSIKAIYLR